VLFQLPLVVVQPAMMKYLLENSIIKKKNINVLIDSKYRAVKNNRAPLIRNLLSKMAPSNANDTNSQEIKIVNAKSLRRNETAR